MDVRMPEMDGIEATRQLLADGTSDSKVVMLTTFDMDEYVYDALRAGASGFLLKDVPPEQLVSGIHAVGSGDALLAPTVTRRVIEEFVRHPPESVRTAPPELEELTPRELEVLQLIARGLSNAEIAGGARRQRDDGEDARRARPDEAPAAGSRAGSVVLAGIREPSGPPPPPSQPGESSAPPERSPFSRDDGEDRPERRGKTVLAADDFRPLSCDLLQRQRTEGGGT